MTIVRGFVDKVLGIVSHDLDRKRPEIPLSGIFGGDVNRARICNHIHFVDFGISREVKARAR